MEQIENKNKQVTNNHPVKYDLTWFKHKIRPQKNTGLWDDQCNPTGE